MNILSSPGQTIELKLFQPVQNAEREEVGASSSQSLKLSNIEPSGAKITAAVDTTVSPSMRATALGKRLWNIITSIGENGPTMAIKTIAKSLWKGASLGAFTGVCVGGINGALAGFFIGIAAQTGYNTAKNMLKAEKLELLDVAKSQLKDTNQLVTSKGKTKPLNFQDTTLFYTRNRKTLNLSNIKDGIQNQAPAVATALLNQKNNEFCNKLNKLDLSNNGSNVNESFLANLIKMSIPSNATPTPDAPLVNGLSDMTINLRGTGVQSSASLRAALDSLGLNDAQIGETTRISTSKGDTKVVKINIPQAQTSPASSFTLKFDKSFDAPEPELPVVRAATEPANPETEATPSVAVVASDSPTNDEISPTKANP